MSTTDPDALFQEVVRCCGLSALLGPGMVRRALQTLGLDENKAAPDDYLKALPQLEVRLAAYRGPAAASDAIRQITARLSGASRPAAKKVVP